MSASCTDALSALLFGPGFFDASATVAHLRGQGFVDAQIERALEDLMVLRYRHDWGDEGERWFWITPPRGARIDMWRAKMGKSCSTYARLSDATDLEAPRVRKMLRSAPKPSSQAVPEDAARPTPQPADHPGLFKEKRR